MAYLDDSELHDFLLEEIDLWDGGTDDDIFDELGLDGEDDLDNIPLADRCRQTIPPWHLAPSNQLRLST